MKNMLLAVLAFLLFNPVFSQSQQWDKNYFKSPVDFEILLSGTFSELRSDHFHGGIDIKTCGVQGKKIKAAADGYVSRIKISTGGYGKAIYINHPNGLMTVYGHLKCFSPSIEKYVKEQQYKKESFTLDLKIPENTLNVKQGQLIAYSGNTGSSGGPHLHFEIRRKDGAIPVNPMHYGFLISDKRKPNIDLIAIYPNNDLAQVNNSPDNIYLKTKTVNDKYIINNNKPISVYGDISFGIYCYDRQSKTRNKNGVYAIDLFVDDSLIYSTSMDEMPFSKTRYINSLIDYKYYKKNKKRIQRSCIDPNNHLDIYKTVKNNGIYSFTDTLTHIIKYVVKDIDGNNSYIEFPVKGENFTKIHRCNAKKGSFIDHSKAFFINDTAFSCNMPSNSLYKSEHLNFYNTHNKSTCGYDIIQLGDENIPCHKSFTLTLNIDSIPADIQDKIYAVYILDTNKEAYAGGKIKDGKLELRARKFGQYSIAIDTIPPFIQGRNVHNGKDIKGYKAIRFDINDKESGIKSYNAKLNGNWVLMEYESKTGILFYNTDNRMKNGKNIFEVEVEDMKGNTSSVKYELIY
ncbi:MAG: M23 family metallopeptidase [Hyphomicrobiales bacterium]